MPPSDGAASADAAGRVLRILGGKWVAAAVSAAASLGVPDLLADGPLPLDAIVDRLGCDAPALERLLRVLVGEELLARDGRGAYSLTETGAMLRSGELGDLARFVGAPFGWDPWSRLPDSLRSGAAAFEAHHGESLFDYLDRHPAEAQLYQRAIDAFARREARALVEAYDFGDARCVADIGGGQGALLAEILACSPKPRGVLLERPVAVEGARRLFAERGIADRCEAREGDFWRELPSGVDVCIVKHIVHSWDDEAAVDLLRRCAEAVGPDGTVLVIEGLLLPGDRANLTSLLDLEMLVLCGQGRERSKPEMRRLFAAAGLSLERSAALTESARLLVTHPTPLQER